MTRPHRLRATFVGLTATTALALAGCGGDDGGGASGDLAGFVPADTPIYIEGTIRPEGELRENIEGLTSRVAGINDPGGLIIAEIDSELGSGEGDSGSGLSYEDDIEPWLGEDGAAFVGDLAGSEESSGIVLSTTDSEAAQNFIDEIAKMAGDGLESASYDGSDYLRASDGESFGIVDEAVVFAASEEAFKAVADASGGESLEDNGDFSELADQSPEGSLASVFVNAEAFLSEVRTRLEPESRQFFDSFEQQDPGSALVSLVPAADRVEMLALSTAEGLSPQGSAELLNQLPGDAFAALAAPEVGAQLTRVIKQIDAAGIPGEVPPNQLNDALSRFGIDLQAIAESIGDVGLYAAGTNRQNLAGAVVIETTDAQQISGTLRSVEGLLRRRNVPGFKPLPGGASGFSIRDPDELGPQPLVFLVQGNRFVIGYGEQSAREAAAGGGGRSLAGNPAFQKAVSALGGDEPSGFVNLQAILKLVETVRPDVTGESDYQAAKPYLENLAYVIFGSGTQGDLASARFILGLTE